MVMGRGDNVTKIACGMKSKSIYHLVLQEKLPNLCSRILTVQNHL